MKIIHVCSYFNTSALYKNFFNTLAQRNIQQEVFIPLYKNTPLFPKDYGTVRKKEVSKNNLNYFYIDCLNKPERFLLYYRIRKLYKHLIKHIQVTKNSILHAHSLFANGGICYLVKQKVGNKYIVAVRNTDLEILNKLPVYNNLARKIVDGAEHIVFISYSLKNKFLNEFKDEKFKSMVLKKAIVLPNGLNEQWYTHSQIKFRKLNKEVNFIYQGTLHKRKNVDYIIKIIEYLNSIKTPSNLTIIGEGPEKKHLIELINTSNFKDSFFLKSWTNSFEQVIENYRHNDIFIMPSVGETFGISYIEALAMGKPIIYKKDDGIYGFFNEVRVGEALEMKNIKEDVNRVQQVIYNYKTLSKNAFNESRKFSWNNISTSYINLYTRMGVEDN